MTTQDQAMAAALNTTNRDGPLAYTEAQVQHIVACKDRTIDRQQTRLAELTFARDKALFQVEVARRLINSQAGDITRLTTQLAGRTP